MVYGNYQTSLVHKQGQIKGAQVQKGNPSCGLSPSSGLPNTQFTISGSGLHANNSEVSITWDDEILSTSSNTTDELGNFTAEASVPENVAAGKYKVEIQTTGLELALFNNKPEFSWQNLLIKKVFAKTKTSQTTKKAHSFFTVTEPESIPTEESTYTTTATAMPTQTITTTAITEPSQTITPSVTSTTSETTPATTQNTSDTTTAAPTSSLVATSITTTTLTNSISTTSETSAQTVTATAFPAPTNPQVSIMPIIIENERTGDTVIIDKNKAQANGKDSITVTIDSQNNNIVPQIEVSGEENTISEIKKEDDKFVATISSTKPETKNISVKSQGKEIANTDINFTNTNLTQDKNQLPTNTPFYKNWVFWISILGLILLIAIWIIDRRKTGR